MLHSLLHMDSQTIQSYLLGYLYTLPVLFIAFPVHECAHALVAYALGDRTAKWQGRLTLDPLKHLDPMGTICLILFRFGWAKPVPVNPNNFKNPRVGMALTSIAGPLSNLLMAFLSLVLLRVVQVAPAMQGASGVGATLVTVLVNLLTVSAEINTGLFLFNLIPIPPLDGSRVLMLFLSRGAEAMLYRYEGIIQIVLLGALFLGFLTTPLVAAEQAVLSGMWSLLP